MKLLRPPTTAASAAPAIHRHHHPALASVAAAAPVSSSTARGGRQYKFGPSLKPVEKLPYEMTVEENKQIVQAQVKDFFETK